MSGGEELVICQRIWGCNLLGVLFLSINCSRWQTHYITSIIKIANKFNTFCKTMAFKYHDYSFNFQNINYQTAKENWQLFYVT